MLSILVANHWYTGKSQPDGSGEKLPVTIEFFLLSFISNILKGLFLISLKIHKRDSHLGLAAIDLTFSLEQLLISVLQVWDIY